MVRPSRNLAMLTSAFVVALVLTGCVRKRPALPAVDEPDQAPDVAEVVKPDDARFSSPALQEKFRRMRAAADALARDWKTTPFSRSTKPAIHGTYRATWSNSLDAYDGMPINYHGRDEVHCCSLEAYFDKDRPAKGPPLFVGLRLEALYKPAGQGWGARIDYRTFDGVPAPRPGAADESFGCYLLHYHTLGQEAPPCSGFEVYGRGCATYSEWFHFGKGPEVRYQFTASVHPAINDAARLRKVVPDAGVRSLFASSEVFRDDLVTAFTKLLEEVEKKVKSDVPLHGVSHKPLRPNEPRVQPPPHRLTPEEQKEVLEAARKDVTARIDTVREQHQLMYAAAQKAFPLRDCLPE